MNYYEFIMEKLEATKKIIWFIEDKGISGKNVAAIFGMEKRSYYSKIAMIKAKYGNRYFTEMHYFLLLKSYKLHAEKQLEAIVEFCREEFRQSVRNRINCRYFLVRFIKLLGIKIRDASAIIGMNYHSARNNDIKISSEQMKQLIAYYKSKYEREIAEISKILLG